MLELDKDSILSTFNIGEVASAFIEKDHPEDFRLMGKYTKT